MPAKPNAGGHARDTALRTGETVLGTAQDEYEQQMYRLAEIFAEIFEVLQYDSTLSASEMEEAA